VATPIYAIAKGRGGSLATGLFSALWEDIEPFVLGYLKLRYRRVKTAEEGIAFISHFYKAKGVRWPRWTRGKSPYYSSIDFCDDTWECLRGRTLLVVLPLILAVAEATITVEGKVEDSSSDLEVEQIFSRTRSKGSCGEKIKDTVVGVDSSMGKELEIFGVSLKNVDRLEQGLAPSGLGKRTVHLLLEQVEDMSAYPCHQNPKSSGGSWRASAGGHGDELSRTGKTWRLDGCGLEDKTPKLFGVHSLI